MQQEDDPIEQFQCSECGHEFEIKLGLSHRAIRAAVHYRNVTVAVTVECPHCKASSNYYECRAEDDSPDNSRVPPPMGIRQPHVETRPAHETTES